MNRIVSMALTFVSLVCSLLFLAPPPVMACDPYLSADGAVVRVEKNAAWLTQPNQIRWVFSEALPTDAPVTGAYVLAFVGDAVLVGRHRERGWDILGGHVDQGEDPAHAAVREAAEESGAKVRLLKLVGYEEIVIFGPKPEGYKYPYPKSYQAYYVAEIEDLGEFHEEEDMVERRVMSMAEAESLVAWTSRNRTFFQRARALFNTASKTANGALP